MKNVENIKNDRKPFETCPIPSIPINIPVATINKINNNTYIMVTMFPEKIYWGGAPKIINITIQNKYDEKNITKANNEYMIETIAIYPFSFILVDPILFIKVVLDIFDNESEIMKRVKIITGIIIKLIKK